MERTDRVIGGTMSDGHVAFCTKCGAGFTADTFACTAASPLA